MNVDDTKKQTVAIEGELVSPTKIISGRAKGGFARKESLSPNQRRSIARKAAIERWRGREGELIEATNEGKLPIGDIELDCYVLKDKRRIFNKKALGRALGMKSGGGNVFLRTFNRKGVRSVIPDSLMEKLENPILFKRVGLDPAHGYEGAVLIEICDALCEARKQGKLTKTQEFLGVQAEIILRSSAKIGIIALIDEATGYVADRQRAEYRELFREFIREEVRQWEKEFPDQFFDIIYKMYNLRRKSPNRHPQFFGHFINKYIYTPLANSNGAILEVLREKNPVVYINGGRRYKMSMFLTDIVGLPAFRQHLWQVVGIGNATRSKEGFERGFRLAFPQSGDQLPIFPEDSEISEKVKPEVRQHSRPRGAA